MSPCLRDSIPLSQPRVAEQVKGTNGQCGHRPRTSRHVEGNSVCQLGVSIENFYWPSVQQELRPQPQTSAFDVAIAAMWLRVIGFLAMGMHTMV